MSRASHFKPTEVDPAQSQVHNFTPRGTHTRSPVVHEPNSQLWSQRPAPITSIEAERQTRVSTPPRRVPSLYPTSPPASIPPSRVPPQAKPVAHSLRPKSTPVTMESLKEQRSSVALVQEELSEQTLYELFEVEPTVSEDELRRAYKRVWACFHPDHYASYGLYSRSQLEALLSQFQSAFELLMDSEQRRQYDLKTFPEGIPYQAQRKREVASRLTPTFQTLVPIREARALWDTTRPPETLGASLRELRERFNLPLSVVHERSKISISMLELIESDAFAELPAEVYLRGFIKELLQLFGIQRLVDLDGYLTAYRARRIR